MSSSMASSERVSTSHHAYLDSRTAYRHLVMNLLTGPNASPMEIILPTILANLLATTCLDWQARLSRQCSAAIFSWGISICPRATSTTNPSHSNRWVGSQTDFVACATKPALSRVSCTNRLAFTAACWPLTAHNPSSKYTTILRPSALQ